MNLFLQKAIEEFDKEALEEALWANIDKLQGGWG